MAIKFKFDGIEFEVSTPREAAQVLRELRRVNKPTPQFGGIWGDFDQALSGGVSRVEIHDDRAIKARSAAIAKDLRAAQQTLKVETAAAIAAEANTRLAMVLDFLTAMRGARRMTAEQAGRALKINHPKGLGPRSMLINNVLLKHGFEPNQVYTNTERTSEGRIWVAGAKIDEAIAAIEHAKQKEFMFS